MLSSITLPGTGPTLAVEGATAAMIFEACVERVLAPSLRTKQIAVMNKLGAQTREDQGAYQARRKAESWYICRPTPRTMA